MSVDTTMAVLYAQTGLGTSFANAAAVTPQAAVAMSRILATEMAKQEQHQVEKTQETDRAKFSADKRGGGRGGSLFGSRRRRHLAQAGGEEAGAPASPLVGNLLNVKV